MVANRPKRPGCSCTSFAPYSLMARLSERDSAASPYQVPGWTCDSTEVAIPLLSISSSDICGDHFGAPILCLVSASRCTGGRKW